MKNLLFALIFIGAGVGAGYYLSTNKISINVKPTNETTSETVSMPQEKVAEPVPDPVQPTVPLKGSVSGKLCYPSEGIPPLNVYLQNADTNTYLMVKTLQNQGMYEFTGVPVGTYMAYAYPQSGDGSFGGGYTPAVACGLSVDCKDHSLIKFEIASEKVTAGADICDWYGAQLPAKPQ